MNDCVGCARVLAMAKTFFLESFGVVNLFSFNSLILFDNVSYFLFFYIAFGKALWFTDRE